MSSKYKLDWQIFVVLRTVKQISLEFSEANVAGGAVESVLLSLAQFYNVWIYR